MLIFIVHISTSLCWKIDMSNFVDCEICFDTRALLLSIAVIFLWHHEFRNLIKGKGGNWLTPWPSHRHTSICNNQNNDFNYFRIVFGISIRLKFHKCNLTSTFFKRNLHNFSPLCHSCHGFTDKTSTSLFRKVSHYLFLHLYSELFTVRSTCWLWWFYSF